ncbi:MAG: VOC family protein [Chloroflexota bacterium]
MKETKKTIKALGEIALRVKDMKAMREFYEKVLGLEAMGEFEKLVFLKVAPGYGGHIQLLALFDESMPPDHVRARPFAGKDLQRTSLHHIAFAIDQSDYNSEMERLQRLGFEVGTMIHDWTHWRSLYILDPEGNTVELVCYDSSKQ